MKEKDVESEAIRSLRAIPNCHASSVIDAIRCPRCAYLIYPHAAAGTFDIKCQRIDWDTKTEIWHAIEVKRGDTSIPFSSIDEKKRAWAARKKAEYRHWLWLCIGRSQSSKAKPRRTWLVPFQAFLDLELFMSRKSIPWGHADLGPYELVWDGRGIWTIPTGHPWW